MKKDNKSTKYLFEYNLLNINVLSVFILVVCIYGNKLVEHLLGKNFIETTGIGILENAADDEAGRMLLAFFIIAFVVVFLWFILHEIIHGIAYRIMGAKKDDITYGIVLEKGIFYCKCSSFVSKKCILVSVLAPFVLIGVVTYIIGAIFNLGWLVYLSLLNMMGAAGDLAMFSFFIGRDKEIKFKELDDSATFCLETKEDLSNKKFLFVKLKSVVTDEKEVKEEKNKLITISKSSYGILIVILIIFVIALLSIFV